MGTAGTVLARGTATGGAASAGPGAGGGLEQPSKQANASGRRRMESATIGELGRRDTAVECLDRGQAPRVSSMRGSFSVLRATQLVSVKSSRVWRVGPCSQR